MNSLKRVLSSQKVTKQYQRDLFLDSNRAEIRALYRQILKGTSRAIPRKLEREARLVELKTLFRHHQFETDENQINELKMVYYAILDRIEAGVYPPFPIFTQI